MEQLGYEFGPSIRPRTLEEILRLHEIVSESKGIHVAQLADNELRKMLHNSGHRVGPINSVTRAIYQRTLLEALANETIYESQGESGSEGEEEEEEGEDRPNELYPIVKRRKPIEEETDPVIPTPKEVKKKSGDTLLYAGIVLFIGSVVFIFYLYF